MTPDLDRFFRDVMADAFSTVSAQQWRERAEQFRWARPRAGDYPGQATIEERRERWRRLTAIAGACDAKAVLIEQHGIQYAEVETEPIWEAA